MNKNFNSPHLTASQKIKSNHISDISNYKLGALSTFTKMSLNHLHGLNF